MNWKERRENDRAKRFAGDALRRGVSVADEIMKTGEMLGAWKNDSAGDKLPEDTSPWARGVITAARYADRVRNWADSDAVLPAGGEAFSAALKKGVRNIVDSTISHDVPLLTDNALGEMGRTFRRDGINVGELFRMLKDVRTVQKNLPRGVKKNIEAAAMQGLSRAFMNPVADAAESLYRVPLEAVKGLGRWITGQKIERPLRDSERKFAENAVEYALATKKVPDGVRLDRRQRKAARDYAVKRISEAGYADGNGEARVRLTENRPSAKSGTGRRIDIGVAPVGSRDRFAHGPVSLADDLGLNSAAERLKYVMSSSANIAAAGDRVRKGIRNSGADMETREYFAGKRQDERGTAAVKQNGGRAVRMQVGRVLKRRKSA